MGIVSFLEGIGIFLLVPLISIFGIIEMDAKGSKFITLFLFMEKFPKIVVLLCILLSYVLLVILQNLLQRNLAIRNVKISQGFIRQIRIETYRGLLKTSWGFYTKEKKTDLINIMTMELARVAGGIIQFLQFITSLIFSIIQIGMAFYLSIKLTTFVLIAGLTLSLFSKKFIKQSKSLGFKTSVLAQEYLSGITDQLNGIKEIKSNSLEESRLNWLKSLTKGMINEQIDYIKLKTASQSFYKITSAILIAFFIFFYVVILKVRSEELVLIFVIFSRIWPRITDIQSSMEQIASTLPAFKSLTDLQLKCKMEIEDKDQADSKNILPLQMERGLRCSEVYFRYNEKLPTYALKNINLEIPFNRMTAIVGPSGAGKSTLIDLLIGLNKPEKGEILIDGINLYNENLQTFRRFVSYVAQEPFLFNGSIRDNLLLVEPNSSDEQIWRALEFSSAADFVRELPLGLDTVIGDRGVRLSGGERQRIVIARAILRNPSILVLDEATSALDTENESKIQEALERLKGKMTIIVIAHRLSTIRNADQVIVLEQGEIIQQGQFYQLAAEKRGLFRQLLNKQIEVSV